MGSQVRSGNTTPGSRTPTNWRNGDNPQTSHWEADSANCYLCARAFARSRMITRHHCRVCGKNVCGQCSPSLVQMSSWPAPQRCCTPCAQIAEVGPSLRDRIATISQQLYVIHDPQAVASHPESITTLPEAVAVCEGAVLPLKVSQTRHCDTLARLGERLHAAAEVDAEAPPGRVLEAAVGFCEAGADAVEERLAAALRMLEREREESTRLRDSLRSAEERAAAAEAAAAAAKASARNFLPTLGQAPTPPRTPPAEPQQPNFGPRFSEPNTPEGTTPKGAASAQNSLGRTSQNAQAIPGGRQEHENCAKGCSLM